MASENPDFRDVWEVLAVRYGSQMTPRRNDYFVWIIRNAEQTILVDCGFDEASAARRGRPAFGDVPALLRQVGVDPQTLQTLIVTHLHFDHVGCLASFPAAHFHLQAADIVTATGPDMTNQALRGAYDVEHIKQMVGYVHAGRVTFHDGDGVVAPGITLHRLDGHATGLQCVRVNTARGHVVIASDAAPFFKHVLERNVSIAVIDPTAMLKSYERLRSLAGSVDNIVPGHDPLICEIYPRLDRTEFAFRLDVPPLRSLES